METTPPVINCTRRHFGFPQQQQMPISEKARAFTLSEKMIHTRDAGSDIGSHACFIFIHHL
jgi:hypothetical protein